MADARAAAERAKGWIAPAGAAMALGNLLNVAVYGRAGIRHHRMIDR